VGRSVVKKYHRLLTRSTGECGRRTRPHSAGTTPCEIAVDRYRYYARGPVVRSGRRGLAAATGGRSAGPSRSRDRPPRTVVVVVDVVVVIIIIFFSRHSWITLVVSRSAPEFNPTRRRICSCGWGETEEEVDRVSRSPTNEIPKNIFFLDFNFQNGRCTVVFSFKSRDWNLIDFTGSGS